MEKFLQPVMKEQDNKGNNMTIKEIYDRIRTRREGETFDRDREERRRRFDAHNEREKREHDGEWEKQVVLLKVLQTLGIIGMIEEFTGERMRIVEKDGKVLVGYDRPRYKSLDEDDNPSQTPTEPEWSWEIVSPHLSRKDGVWNPALRIRIGQVDNLMWGNFNGDSVIISYYPCGELEIMGREVVFRGELPPDSTIRTTLVERKLAEALVNPIPKGEVGRRLYPDSYKN